MPLLRVVPAGFTEDRRTRLQVRMEGETVWLSQRDMAELFQTTKQNVNLHIQNIFEEWELTPEATVKDYLTVQTEGSRQVERPHRRTFTRSTASTRR